MRSIGGDGGLGLSFPAESLSKTTDPLATRVRGAALAAVSPVVLTSVLIAGYVAVAGRGDIPRAVVDGTYGVAALAVLGGVAAALDGRERRAAMRFRVPDRVELGWTLAFLPLSVGAFLLGTTAGELLGFELPALGYALGDPVTLAAVVFGTIVVAPLVEEVLFRGLLLGSLLGRGLSPTAAGVLSVGLFAAVHVVALGVPGVLAVGCWAVFPTLLRLRFDNLTGAWLLHLLNNAYANLVVVWLGWA